MASCVLVGISGGTASGKSTLTAALGDALQEAGISVQVIHADRYMRRDREGAPTFVSPSRGIEMFNANHPESVDWSALLRDLAAIAPPPEGPAVVLLEGLMVLHVAQMRERLDLRIFVELDADERALRRMLRDMTGVRGNGDPQFIATYYRECARVGHAQYIEPSRVHADLIVRGDAQWERLRPMLVAVVTAQVEARANAEA